ncbi:MAG: aminotransferase class V-fold PLP-dependent enzyme [Aquisalimonadaceae bacterium]
MHPQFPLDDSLIYLNHAGVGPWPQRTRDAIAAFADENLYRGAAAYRRWLQTETQLRKRLAELINAPTGDDIALVKNTSEGLSFIAYGLSWNAGDEIIINRQEFPSNRVVWESLATRGVKVVDVDLASAATPEDALIDAIGANTRMLAVSSVQYGTGLRMNLPPLAAACRQHGILFCVDAIQSLGALRFDLGEVDADFVVADGHKWMLGPEGVGLFYCCPSIRDQLQLTQYGWHMLEHAGDYDRTAWEVARSARRFECGSPNMLGIHGLEASLSVLQGDGGLAEVERKVLNNVTHLVDLISRSERLELISSSEPERLSGIVTFTAPGADSYSLYSALMESGVICASRGGGVRFSPHFYTPPAAVAEAVARAEALARTIIG